MDRYYFYQQLAQERQHEVSKELANRHLLRNGKEYPFTAKQARRLVWRAAFAVVTFVLLAFYMIG